GALAITASALARIAIVPFQTPRRDAGEKKRLKHPHLEYRAPYPFLFPASRGRENTAAQTSDPASALERLGEGHIFHERNIRKAAQFSKNLPPHKDSLIAGGHSAQSGSQVDHRADHTEHPMRAVQLHIKTAPNTLGLTKRMEDIIEGRAGKTSVGVKEKQDIAGCLPGSVIHFLCTTSACRHYS